ncbi:hypothetical protein [Collinsella tanakaei]|uniref:hypothetical protein n=1 Tax=Collinsella tanakaei TaxID=626935 RepID=UPI00216B0015|nr:hypothetical protein [Collinsella tanakaei]
MRKKTALIAAIGALIIFGAIASALFSSGGDTKSVQRIAAPTSLYGEADISSAFDALRRRSPQTLRDAPLKNSATTARLKKRFWTMNSIANKRELKTASSSYQRSQPTGDLQTKASRQMRRTKTGSGYSPGLRKTPHGAWKAGDIASAIRTKPKRTSSVSHTQSQWKTTINATAYRTMES